MLFKQEQDIHVGVNTLFFPAIPPQGHDGIGIFVEAEPGAYQAFFKTLLKIGVQNPAVSAHKFNNREIDTEALDKVIERAVFRVGDAIAEGRPMAEPLMESGVFPNMVVQMINVGESVGALDTMLEKIADFYDEEVDTAVANLTAMIEPFMMVFLGGMIGTLVVAMYLPIFEMAGHV